MATRATGAPRPTTVMAAEAVPKTMSTLPATSACVAAALPWNRISLRSSPYFLAKPSSSATQIGKVCVDTKAMPTLTFCMPPWALAAPAAPDPSNSSNTAIIFVIFLAP